MTFARTRQRLACAALLSLTTLLAIGCQITTPDGIVFPPGASESQVRARLGEPEMVTSQDRSWKGPYSVQRYHYLERGYTVYFHDHRIRSASDLHQLDWTSAANQLGGPRVQELRDAPPRPGISIWGVETKWGRPDVVSKRDGARQRTSVPDNRPLEHPRVEETRWYYMARDYEVVFKRVYVTEVRKIDPEVRRTLESFLAMNGSNGAPAAGESR